MKTSRPDSLALVKLCCRALEDKKAGDLRVLDVHEQSSITDYLVVATGTSDPHLRALRVELEKVIDAAGTRILGMDAARESGWLVIDAFDVMFHLFLPDQRQKYGLENLWKDAAELPVAKLLATPKAAAKKKTAAKKTAAKKTTVKKKPASKKKKSG
ncbi:MAG: ribosome silencing factor [Opitutaceae bacterium]|nr:ribosome silencing factor [Opitutaceae bacterium]